MKSYRSSSTFVTIDLLFHELLPFFKIRFPDFSRLCFHISHWQLVASFHMKSYISSSTFVTVDLLFHELWPFLQNLFSGLSLANLFSGLFLAIFSHIWMKVGRKLPYEYLRIKFNFVTVDLLFNDLFPFLKSSFPHFSSFCMKYTSSLKHQIIK